MSQKGLCFFLMPFLPHAGYFYEYLKQHIEATTDLECRRADTSNESVPIIDEIRQSIQQADVIIADCTGANANVFYELGYAHALNKPTILITADKPEHTPFDVRHLRLILLQEPERLLPHLDDALQSALAQRVSETLYAKALELFEAFRRDQDVRAEVCSLLEFAARLRGASAKADLPSVNDDARFASFVLPLIIANSSDLTVMRQIIGWVDKKTA